MRINNEIIFGCDGGDAGEVRYSPCESRRDPTAGVAIRRVDRAERAKKQVETTHPKTRVWRSREDDAT